MASGDQFQFNSTIVHHSVLSQSKICTIFFSDWSKYFRGKKIHGEYDIRVEQAEFKELSVNSSSINGVVASIILAKSGNKVVRSFKPDFLLVRQNSRDAHEDHRSILYGFQYGNIPSVNTLESLYNFQVLHKYYVGIHLCFSKRNKNQFQ